MFQTELALPCPQLPTRGHTKSWIHRHLIPYNITSGQTTHLMAIAQEVGERAAIVHPITQKLLAGWSSVTAC